MAKKKRTPTEVLDVTIQKIDPKGYGFARYVHPPTTGSLGKHLKLFIPNTVPDDVVRVTVPNARGRRRATVDYDELLTPSPKRNPDIPIDQPVPGGVPLQFMAYEDQLAYKAQLVHDYLAEGEFDTSVIQPIIGMTQPYRYRNKMELTFGPDGELGMHQQSNYLKIIDLVDSPIATKEMLQMKRLVSAWQHDHQISGYDKATHTGCLRKLRLRQSFATGELMVVLYANAKVPDLGSAIDDLVQRLTTSLPQIASIIWIENTDISDQVQTDTMMVVYGREWIQDELNGFTYHIHYDTFFQVNPVQAEKMVQAALEIANVDKETTVLDLFCGMGTFSLPFAARAKQLTGIEIVENSILSAQQNAKQAGLENTHFFVSDARQGLEQLKQSGNVPDFLILNPPRSGAGGKLMRSIGRFGCEQVLYISCQPKTLALDLRWLRDFGYHIETVQPIDQFPHTVHVETVVLMSRK